MIHPRFHDPHCPCRWCALPGGVSLGDVYLSRAELDQNPDELPDRWRPVEVARTVLDAPPVPYEIVDTASGEVVQAGELPADHPVIQALEQDPATYTGAAMVSWPDARLDLS